MNESRNFEEDLSKYDNPELRKSWEEIFKKEFGSDVGIIWKDDNTSQLAFGCDVLIKTSKGRKYSIDVKGRDPKYKGLTQWTIELFHHYYTDASKEVWLGKKEGWLYCSTADYIFYGTVSEDYKSWVEYVGFSLIPFKEEEFKGNITNLPYYAWVPTQYKTKWQLTYNKIMDLTFLKENANKFWYWRKE